MLAMRIVKFIDCIKPLLQNKYVLNSLLFVAVFLYLISCFSFFTFFLLEVGSGIVKMQ